jgi:UPF0755 protein
MPDTPDKKKSNFQKEGLSFPPPKPSAKPGPKPPARPVPPLQFDQSSRPAQKTPERKTVLPKGYVPPASKTERLPRSAPKPAGQTRPARQPGTSGAAGASGTAKQSAPVSGAKPAGTPKSGARPASKLEQKAALHGIKLRRKPRAFTGFLAGMLYVLIVLGGSFWMGTTAWSWAMDVLALQKQPVETTITYTEDMSISDLARLLKREGLIEHEWLFKLYCDFSDAEEKMSPGEYVTKIEETTSAKDYRALVYMMTPGSADRAEVTVTFPEGLTMAQIFQRLDDNKVASVEALEEAAATINWNATRHPYLKNLPAVPNRLEGYLFPDTYTFYVNETPQSALQKLVREFDNRMTADFRKRAEEMGYTLHEIVTIASMIEAESGADEEERKNIASVIYNRLENWQIPMLNIDATLLYFMEGRREITAEDLLRDHPYNTYFYPGLPPGPICSPSFESIRAALNPNKTQYYFYLLDDEDVTQFSRTSEEHEQKRASYDRYN